MSTTNTQSNEVNAPATPEADTRKEIILGDFGNGRYSPVMEELFSDVQRLLGFSPEQAHATALRIGIDAGQLQSLKVEKLKFGAKVSKDGRRTLKEVTQAGKFLNSWAMSIGAICSQLDETRKQGLVLVEATVSEHLLEFVNKSAAKIKGVEKLTESSANS